MSYDRSGRVQEPKVALVESLPHRQRYACRALQYLPKGYHQRLNYRDAARRFHA